MEDAEPRSDKVFQMFRSWLFLNLGIIAGVAGFGEIAAAITDIAKLLFYVFMTLFVILLVRELRARM